MIEKIVDLTEEDQKNAVCVLSKDYFANHGIPHSLSIPHNDDFLPSIHRLFRRKHHPIVLYCANLSCDASDKAGKVLEEDGYTNIRVYSPGADSYPQKNHRIRKPAKKGPSPWWFRIVRPKEENWEPENPLHFVLGFRDDNGAIKRTIEFKNDEGGIQSGGYEYFPREYHAGSQASNPTKNMRFRHPEGSFFANFMKKIKNAKWTVTIWPGIKGNEESKYFPPKVKDVVDFTEEEMSLLEKAEVGPWGNRGFKFYEAQEEKKSVPTSYGKGSSPWTKYYHPRGPGSPLGGTAYSTYEPGWEAHFKAEFTIKQIDFISEIIDYDINGRAQAKLRDKAFDEMRKRDDWERKRKEKPWHSDYEQYQQKYGKNHRRRKPSKKASSWWENLDWTRGGDANPHPHQAPTAVGAVLPIDVPNYQNRWIRGKPEVDDLRRWVVQLVPVKDVGSKRKVVLSDRNMSSLEPSSLEKADAIQVRFVFQRENNGLVPSPAIEWTNWMTMLNDWRERYQQLVDYLGIEFEMENIRSFQAPPGGPAPSPFGNDRSEAYPISYYRDRVKQQHNDLGWSLGGTKESFDLAYTIKIRTGEFDMKTGQWKAKKGSEVPIATQLIRIIENTSQANHRQRKPSIKQTYWWRNMKWKPAWREKMPRDMGPRSNAFYNPPQPFEWSSGGVSNSEFYDVFDTSTASCDNCGDRANAIRGDMTSTGLRDFCTEKCWAEYTGNQVKPEGYYGKLPETPFILMSTMQDIDGQNTPVIIGRRVLLNKRESPDLKSTPYRIHAATPRQPEDLSIDLDWALDGKPDKTWIWDPGNRLWWRDITADDDVESLFRRYEPIRNHRQRKAGHPGKTSSWPWEWNDWDDDLPYPEHLSGTELFNEYNHPGLPLKFELSVLEEDETQRYPQEWIDEEMIIIQISSHDGTSLGVILIDDSDYLKYSRNLGQWSQLHSDETFPLLAWQQGVRWVRKEDDRINDEKDQWWLDERPRFYLESEDPIPGVHFKAWRKILGDLSEQNHRTRKPEKVEENIERKLLNSMWKKMTRLRPGQAAKDPYFDGDLYPYEAHWIKEPSNRKHNFTQLGLRLGLQKLELKTLLVEQEFYLIWELPRHLRGQHIRGTDEIPPYAFVRFWFKNGKMRIKISRTKDIKDPDMISIDKGDARGPPPTNLKKQGVKKLFKILGLNQANAVVREWSGRRRRGDDGLYAHDFNKHRPIIRTNLVDMNGRLPISDIEYDYQDSKKNHRMRQPKPKATSWWEQMVWFEPFGIGRGVHGIHKDDFVEFDAEGDPVYEDIERIICIEPDTPDIPEEFDSFDRLDLEAKMANSHGRIGFRKWRELIESWFPDTTIQLMWEREWGYGEWGGDRGWKMVLNASPGATYGGNTISRVYDYAVKEIRSSETQEDKDFLYDIENHRMRQPKPKATPWWKKMIWSEPSGVGYGFIGVDEEDLGRNQMKGNVERFINFTPAYKTPTGYTMRRKSVGLKTNFDIIHLHIETDYNGNRTLEAAAKWVELMKSWFPDIELEYRPRLDYHTGNDRIIGYSSYGDNTISRAYDYASDKSLGASFPFRPRLSSKLHTIEAAMARGRDLGPNHRIRQPKLKATSWYEELVWQDAFGGEEPLSVEGILPGEYRNRHGYMPDRVIWIEPQWAFASGPDVTHLDFTIEPNEELMSEDEMVEWDFPDAFSQEEWEEFVQKMVPDMELRRKYDTFEVRVPHDGSNIISRAYDHAINEIKGSAK